MKFQCCSTSTCHVILTSERTDLSKITLCRSGRCLVIKVVVISNDRSSRLWFTGLKLYI